MIGNRKVLALIPARGGSKGIKNKNIIDLNGHPLLYYSIRASLESRYTDDVIVSTDSGKIKEIAVQYGAACPFLRPRELASDEARTIDAVLYTLTELKVRGYEYQILVILQPTSPLRNAADIDAALELFETKKGDVVSVCESRESPVLCRLVDDAGTMKSLIGGNSTIRRQDMTVTYHVNGALYVNDISVLTEKTSFNDNPVPYIMPGNRSVDIDKEEDLELARYYMDRKS